MKKAGDTVYNELTKKTYLVEKVLDGKDKGGKALCASATSDGQRFFIKQDDKLRHPLDATLGKPETKAKMREEFMNYFNYHKPLYDAVKKQCESTSNINCSPIIDFFRDGVFLMTVYEQHEQNKSVTPTVVATKDRKVKLRILSQMANRIKPLHDVKLVHSDLKPDNILFIGDEFGVKIIDMDGCYKSGNPPEVITCTEPYMSPELLANSESKGSVLRGLFKKKNILTTKADIFALGVIFCEYFSGSLPLFDKGKYDNCCAKAVNDSVTISFPSIVTSESGLCALLQMMLHKNPDERPDINAIIDMLDKIGKGETLSFPKKEDSSGSLLKKKPLKPRSGLTDKKESPYSGVLKKK